MGKCNTMCNVLLSLAFHFPGLSLSVSPDSHWGFFSNAHLSRGSGTHALRRPRAVCRCGPLSMRTHLDLCHHVMCLFDTSYFSCIEFVSSSLSSTLLSRVVLSPSPSCHPGPLPLFLASPGRQLFSFALFAPPEPLLLSLAVLALPEPSLIYRVPPGHFSLLAPPALFSPLAPRTSCSLSI